MCHEHKEYGGRHGDMAVSANADVAQLEEYEVANLDVAGSNPVIRSMPGPNGAGLSHALVKPLLQSLVQAPFTDPPFGVWSESHTGRSRRVTNNGPKVARVGRPM